jgi:hypothetical protein
MKGKAARADAIHLCTPDVSTVPNSGGGMARNKIWGATR